MADPTAVTGGERKGKAVTGGSASLPNTQGRTPGTQQGHLGCHSTRAFHTFVVTTPSTKTRRDKEMGKKKVFHLALPLNIPARAAPVPAARGCKGGEWTSPRRAGQPWGVLEWLGGVWGSPERGRGGSGSARGAPVGRSCLPRWGAERWEALYNGRLPGGTWLGRSYVTTLLNTGLSRLYGGAPAADQPGKHLRRAPCPASPIPLPPRRPPNRTRTTQKEKKKKKFFSLFFLFLSFFESLRTARLPRDLPRAPQPKQGPPRPAPHPTAALAELEPRRSYRAPFI